MSNEVGKITWISGPVVRARGSRHVGMLELVEVGEDHLVGEVIGLKGFVPAIVGGLASYPAALAGALLVGQLEAFSSFWASAFKEVLVFTLIIPVLWWRSLRSRHVEDEE